MDSILYRGNCYSTAISAHTAMAADCLPVTDSGQSLTCLPTDAGYSVQVGSGAVFHHVASDKICVPEVVDSVELGGLVIAALAAAYALKLIRRAF